MADEEKVLNNHYLHLRCTACLGQGRILAYRCSECGIEIEAGQFIGEGGEVAIPCGHSAESYVAFELVCQNCEGAGQVRKVVSKEAFDAARRRRLARGAVLFVLALIPLLMLGWAVLNTEPEAVCGSWWYGVMVPAMLVAHYLWRR